MSKVLSAIGIAAGLLITSLSASAQNLVTNGSFETTSGITASSVITNSDLPGWTVNYTGTFAGAAYKFAAVYYSAAAATTTGATGTDDQDPYWVMASLNAKDSSDGGHFIAIDGDPGFSAVLSQTISGLTVGHTYTLSFLMAGAQEDDKFGNTTDSWRVTFGNQTRDSTIITNTTHGFTDWISQSMTFTASSTSQILSFLAVGTPTGLPPVSLLDGVSLVDSTVPAVPEPSSWAMLLAGVGAMGFMLRKRNN
ncbi:PEPxxWA-CTERM sorting domain-containing protein [Rhizobacter fulvus]